MTSIVWLNLHFVTSMEYYFALLCKSNYKYSFIFCDWKHVYIIKFEVNLSLSPLLNLRFGSIIFSMSVRSVFNKTKTERTFENCLKTKTKNWTKLLIASHKFGPVLLKTHTIHNLTISTVLFPKTIHENCRLFSLTNRSYTWLVSRLTVVVKLTGSRQINWIFMFKNTLEARTVKKAIVCKLC